MRRLDPLDISLLTTGGIVLVALALTESFGQLVAASAAYAIAWWVLGLERPRSGDPR